MSNTYAIFGAIISIIALVVLAGDVFFVTDPQLVQVIQYIDTTLCLFFFLDFLYSMYIAPNKTKYFFTWGWIDLLSSIPIIDQFRIGRLVRVYRLLRILRGIKAAKLIVQLILQRECSNIALAVITCVLLFLSIGSMAILVFEDVPEANIKTAEDAIWWTYVTITTVGYGDRYPVTTEGRILGGILMTIGVGLFGIFSGFIASWFLKPSEHHQVVELDDVHKEVRELRALVKQLTVHPSSRANVKVLSRLKNYKSLVDKKKK